MLSSWFFNIRRMWFDQSSSVQLVSESRGGPLSMTDEGRTDGRRKILLWINPESCYYTCMPWHSFKWPCEEAQTYESNELKCSTKTICLEETLPGREQNWPKFKKVITELFQISVSKGKCWKVAVSEISSNRIIHRWKATNPIGTTSFRITTWKGHAKNHIKPKAPTKI